MIVLNRTPLGAITNLIELAFTGDKELSEYHITGADLKTCIADTVHKIKEADAMMHLQVYAVNDTELNKTIGFTAICKEYGLLYSFGIAPVHRTKENLINWFQQILLIIPEFKCYLWNKNTRAIEFLKRNGAEVTEKNKKYTQLTYNKKGE